MLKSVLDWFLPEFNGKMDITRSEMYSFKPFHCVLETPRSDEVPIPRSGHRIVYFNGQILSFGGYNKDVFSDVMGDLEDLRKRLLQVKQ